MDKTELFLSNMIRDVSKSKERSFVKAKDNEELRANTSKLFGLQVPDRVICEGHQSPFSFFSDLYFQRQNDILCWACRSGGKTLGIAMLLTLLSMENKRFSSRILGGSSDQSSQCYGHIKKFCEGSLSKYVDGEPLATRVLFANNSEVQMLAASQKSVRGPHPIVLVLDEADEVDSDLYQAAMGMPQSQRGHESITAVLSTMHNRWGLMQGLVDNIEEHGRTLYKWCIFEILEDCADYECSTCFLLDECKKRGKIEGFGGYYKIEDAIKKKRQMSQGAWESEYLCIKPSFEGLVYKEFNPDIHVKDIEYNPSMRTIAGCDFGADHPMVCLVIQEANDVIYVIDEFYESGITGSEFAKICKRLKEKYQIEEFLCDPSGLGIIKEMRDIGLEARGSRLKGNIKNQRNDGIDKIRSKLKNKLMVVSKRVKNLAREFGLYRYKKTAEPGTIVKEDDDALDALRYAINSLVVTPKDFRYLKGAPLHEIKKKSQTSGYN